MQTSRARLLLLLLLGLGLSPIAWTVQGETETPGGLSSALALAVELYNRNSGLDSAFRLLQVKSLPDGEPSNPDLQKLEWILKETTCPNSRDLNPDDCEFKEDGVVKECSGTSSAQPGSPILQIKCDTITPGNRRVKRHGKLRRFFSNFKKKPKKLPPGSFSIIAQAKPNWRFHIA